MGKKEWGIGNREWEIGYTICVLTVLSLRYSILFEDIVPCMDEGSMEIDRVGIMKFCNKLPYLGAIA